MRLGQRVIPLRRRDVPTDEVFDLFATAPVIDAGELRSDLDRDFDQDVRDPFEGTSLTDSGT